MAAILILWKIGRYSFPSLFFLSLFLKVPRDIFIVFTDRF